MRLTTVILIASLVQVSAATFGQRINLRQDNISINTILKEIRKQSGYDIYYNRKVIPESRKINVSLTNASVEEALSAMFNGMDLIFEVEGKTVSIKRKPLTSFNNQIVTFRNIDVLGRVLDKDKIPLRGVSVKVKGTNRVTSTNEKGYFDLADVRDDAVLIFTSLGYVTRELNVSVNMDNIQLEEFVGELEAVEVTVNTGYQRLSKERSAGSFAKPDMNIIKERSTSMNILQRLDGLVPGLTVNQAPGGDPLLLRGMTSLSLARNPLYVVDGVQVSDINSINPQDIEDITVLKDATANSIWGAKAANGVIVIATKRGKEGSSIKINYDSFVNFLGKPDLNYRPVLTNQQYIQASREIFNPAAFPFSVISGINQGRGIAPHELFLYQMIGASPAQTATLNARLDSLMGMDNRQQIKDLFYRNASIMNHTLSLTGGGRVHSFYGSAAFTNDISNHPGEKNKTYKINLRQDFNFNEYLKTYLITDLTYNNQSAPRNINADYSYIPYQLFRDGAGNNISMPYMGFYSDANKVLVEQRSRINMDYVPLDEISLGNTSSNGFLNRIVGGATVTPFAGLRIEGVYGFIKGSTKNTNYTDNRTYSQRDELIRFTTNWEDPSITPTYLLPLNGGLFSTTSMRRQEWTVRHQAIYDKSFKNNLHQISALFGQEAQEQMTGQNGSVLRGYDPDLLSYASIDYASLSNPGVDGAVVQFGGDPNRLADESYNETEIISRFTSYYANAAYTYNSRYSLNGSWRIDKSNLFGLDKSAQNRPIWSAGVKWTLSREGFMKHVSVFDNLAIRATYGLAGNSPDPTSAASKNILGLASQENQGLVPNGRGLFVTTPANPDLSWESTSTFNLGLDFELLNKRIFGSFDFYRKKTDGLLGDLEVNALTGYTSIFGNVGNLSNRGIEFSITSVNVAAGNFSWSTLLNAAYNHNEITSLGYLVIPNTAESGRITRPYVPGYAANSIFAYRYAGLNSVGNPQVYRRDGSISTDGNELTADDAEYMGVSQPKWNGGLSNVFTYKGFGLNINTIFNFGHVVRADVNTFWTGRLTSVPQSFNSGNVHADFANRWKKSGDELYTDIPKYVAQNSANTDRFPEFYRYADKHVIDAAYVKIRDISFSYRFPGNWLSAINVDNATVRFQMNNLMLWKANDEGIDPEFHNAVTGTRSIRNNQGTFALGLNVGF